MDISDFLVSGTVVFLLTQNAAVTLSAQQSAAIGPSLVFDGVTVVDVEQGKLVPAQRIVVTGNRVQVLGSAREVPLPRGAQVVDARGKYLIPGLWDLHVHPFSEAEIFDPLFIVNGVTGIRDARSTEPLAQQVQWWQEILAGTRVGPPRQLLAGEAFGQILPIDDSVQVRQTIDSLKAHGANFLKLYPFAPDVASLVRRAGLAFGGHVNDFSAIEASDSGMSIIDHPNSAGGIDSLCLYTALGASVERCRPVAERFQRNNTWWVPTVGFCAVFECDNRLNLGKASLDLIKRFCNTSRDFWRTDRLGLYALSEVLRPAPGLSRTGSIMDSLGLLRIMQRVGLPIAAGTDVAGTGYMEVDPPGFGLQLELAIYVTEGLTPLEALQTATLNPAKLLHGTDSLGTVAPGKLADLVLLDADPLTDITNITTIRAVVANGRYFDRAALDQLLTAIRLKFRTWITSWDLKDKEGDGCTVER